MPRFLHTADWQIGRQYSRFAQDDAVALAEARFAVVERIAQLASTEAFDAVLVAGDVFDAQTVSDRTIRRLFNALQGFAGPWIMIPGNHDAALAESIWSRAQRLGAIPANVHVALTPDVLEFAEQGFAVLTAPLTQRQTHDDLTCWFDAAETAPGLLRIGLAHGSVQGILAEDIDSPNPIAPERAQRACLDYLALGDWHGVKQIDTRTWYSGTPEQERFKNNGAGQVLAVEIAAPGTEPQVTPRLIGQYVWQHWQVQLTVDSDLDVLLQRLDEVAAPSVLDIALSGQTSLAGNYRLQQALSVAEARHRSVQCDFADLRLQPTDEDIAALHADGYLGEVLAELRECQQTEDAETARDALAILAGLLRDRQLQEGME
ncbi:metallophosphoesterase family protein [Pseudomonas jinjuensis]|uniref:DNA repair exonuclease SbcCD nuclease subunit n=1 Tax=Pseudomonas jinjuensis TaxID=198616 RepID=A0A1H0EG47_9PSED|nr:DNA repair exonuclease [Pseudomonas jinjuensis]SDN81291.1 DNA repair exonuclease SbcCD nuclease subunit [Pseudomonas jinjuensis]